MVNLMGAKSQSQTQHQVQQDEQELRDRKMSWKCNEEWTDGALTKTCRLSRFCFLYIIFHHSFCLWHAVFLFFSSPSAADLIYFQVVCSCLVILGAPTPERRRGLTIITPRSWILHNKCRCSFYVCSAQSFKTLTLTPCRFWYLNSSTFLNMFFHFSNEILLVSSGLWTRIKHYVKHVP